MFRGPVVDFKLHAEAIRQSFKELSSALYTIDKSSESRFASEFAQGDVIGRLRQSLELAKYPPHFSGI